MKHPIQKDFLRLLGAAYDLKTFREGSQSYKAAEWVVNDIYSKYGEMINPNGWMTPEEFYQVYPTIDPSTKLLVEWRTGEIDFSARAFIPISRILDNTFRRIKVIYNGSESNIPRH